VASGSAAGATTSILLYHLDFARTRLATDSVQCHATGQRQFKGLIHVYRKTISSDGVAGLYRGFGVSILGITMYRGMYFGIYDTMKPIVLVGPFEVSIYTFIITLQHRSIIHRQWENMGLIIASLGSIFFVCSMLGMHANIRVFILCCLY